VRDALKRVENGGIHVDHTHSVISPQETPRSLYGSVLQANECYTYTLDMDRPVQSHL